MPKIRFSRPMRFVSAAAVCLGVAVVVLVMRSEQPRDTAEPFTSIEVGFSSLSPAGVTGGLAIPASCPAFEHVPGECAGAVNPQCSPNTQAVAVSVPASLTASGGSGGYSWSTGGGCSPCTGAGSTFNPAYSSSGSKTVVLTDSVGGTDSCTVNVTGGGCSCTGWVNAGCGGGSCPPNQMLQNPTGCTPVGCGAPRCDDTNPVCDCPAATPGTWTDDPVVAGVTPISLRHVNELRGEIDARRALTPLPPEIWTAPDPMTTDEPIGEPHITEMRDAIEDVYNLPGCAGWPPAACGPPPLWVDDPLQPGVTPVRAIHINQLRCAVNNCCR